MEYKNPKFNIFNTIMQINVRFVSQYGSTHEAVLL
jgi:hypothetical protein